MNDPIASARAQLAFTDLNVNIELKLQLLPHSEGLPLPAYQSAGAAGFDLYAAIAQDAPITLLPGQRVLVPSGIALAIAEGFEGQIRPRSSLAYKHAITCLNSPGTIDSDYRGEIKILLVNLGQESFIIERGMRIAQMVIAPVMRARFRLCDELDDTKRGMGGFGSTGK